MDAVFSEVVLPSAPLRAYIKAYIFLRGPHHPETVFRVLPHNTSRLLLSLNDHPFSQGHAGKAFRTLPRHYLFGQLTATGRYQSTGAIRQIGIEFEPSARYFFFRMPMHELTNGGVDADLLKGYNFSELTERLESQSTPAGQAALLNAFFERHLHRLSDDYQPVDLLLPLIRSSVPGWSLKELLARSSSYSYKKLERMFLAQIGITPKQYQKLTRFQYVHALVRQQTDLTLMDLVVEGGYFDQAHLNRDFKDFTEYAPKQFLLRYLRAESRLIHNSPIRFVYDDQEGRAI